MKITIYNKLRKFENHFITAVKANYVRLLTSPQLSELIPIGEELGIKVGDVTCSKCVLTFIQKIGKLYLEQKEKLDEKKAQKELQNKEINNKEENKD